MIKGTRWLICLLLAGCIVAPAAGRSLAGTLPAMGQGVLAGRVHAAGDQAVPGPERGQVPGAIPTEARVLPPPCAVIDPGPKGVHVHPNELPGQTIQIQEADTGWVRLEFKMSTDGSIDLDKYTAIVDSLCQQGVGVIGLVDYVTIPEDLDEDGTKDYNDPDDVIAYQQRFTETVEILANQFQGSIWYWEVWNEENGGQWHIDPEYYARLLVKVSEVVKGVDPENQILFGGLDHAWVTSQYLEPVYDALDLHWEGARPFDILAVHPYFVIRSGVYILDPTVYLWEKDDPSRTVLDKYLAYMASRGDSDVDIWITEIGWNSALDNPAIEACPGMVAWSVTREVQARYLRDSFDILFHEVEDPLGNHDRVKVIVWYQYHDTAVWVGDLAAKLSIPIEEISPNPRAICPADWGLVDGNRVPKLAYWAYRAYPQRFTTYLPFMIKDGPEDGGQP